MTQSINNSDKKRKTTIILAIIAVVIVAIVATVYISGGSGRELRKQLDLGRRFLTEQDYEQAIATFKKAIEIDPMSVDAYLGLADAYVGKGDFETAKSTLEEAIKFFEENGKDATVLTNKLAEIQAEIDRIAAERVALEEKRLAEIPFVAIQPLLDASYVWGRKWDEWTVEEFREKFNVYDQVDENTFFNEKDHLGMTTYYIVEDDTSIRLGELNYAVNNLIQIDKPGNGIDYYSCQIVMPPDRKVDNTAGLYSYAEENGIKDIETFISYLGLSGMIERDEQIEISTEYGNAWAQWRNTYFDIYFDSYSDESNLPIRSINLNQWDDDYVSLSFERF